jgi:hypothetical protein
LVPDGHHYYEGSDFCQPPLTNPPTTTISLSHPAVVAGRRSLEQFEATFLTADLTIDSGLSVELAVLPAYLV